MKIRLAICIAVCFAFSLNVVHAQKDEWVLSSINLLDNSQKEMLQTVPVFEDATMSCLLNSNWKLSVNGQSFYNINSGDNCKKGMRQIKVKGFNMKGLALIQFFRTSAVQGVPADENTTYMFEVGSSDKGSLTLRYPIVYNDKPNTIIFNFTHK